MRSGGVALQRTDLIQIAMINSSSAFISLVGSQRFSYVAHGPGVILRGNLSS